MDGVSADHADGGHTFAEQIAYLEQKRLKPTRAWTDAMGSEHDRAFVVAGATDLAMLEEFHDAVIRAATTWDRRQFAKDFDDIVGRYGWSYNGGREWRINTIFDTNLRTSYMAGRYRQMTDPDVVRLRPFWQYVHAYTRTPEVPRPEHVAWDGLVLLWNDPWWKKHFPPNDWKCSCGVVSLMEEDLADLGKTGPDTAPDDGTEPLIDKVTGQIVQQPKGIGYGWDYQPGAHWEEGLVPQDLQPADPVQLQPLDAPVEIDTPKPFHELLAAARPSAVKPLAPGLSAPDYVSAFLKPFGADLQKAVQFEDRSGIRFPISAQLFRDTATDGWSALLAAQGPDLAKAAEAIHDPDEIWMGMAGVADVPGRPAATAIVRRYIRADPATGRVFVVEFGRRFWRLLVIEPDGTITGSAGKDSAGALRAGKLIWKGKMRT